jgi:hypothetical protein
MRTILKRILIQLYCRGVVRGAVINWAFKHFNLQSA